jgi:hypothetical protein
MKPSTRSKLFLLLGILGCFVAKSYACSCAMYATPCVEFEKAEAVFLGTVLSTSYPWARFDIEQAFKGINTKQIGIRTGLSLRASGDSCQFPFKEGERYVVYAQRLHSSDELYAGSCNRILTAADATPDLEYLGSLSRKESGASVFGKVEKGPGIPVEGIKVLLEGIGDLKGRRFEALTNNRGQYFLQGLSPGGYFNQSGAQR